MANDAHQQVAINFFPLVEQSFAMSFFRKSATANEEAPGGFCRQYKVPENYPFDKGSDFRKYWVTPDEREGFEGFTCPSHTNHLLTAYLLFESLARKCAAMDCEVKRGFQSRVVFPIEQHPEGQSSIWVSPYFLKSMKQLGFLVGFWFQLNEGQLLNREVLRLSHSLDAKYRENKNYYIDRHAILLQFVRDICPKVFPLDNVAGCDVDIRRSIATIPSTLLSPKRYQASGPKTHGSQFMAVKSEGPHTVAPKGSRICFVYRPTDKPLSHDLYKALRGDTFATFSGMEKMFSFELGGRSVFGVPIEDYGYEAVSAAARSICEQSDENGVVVPLVLVPWSRHEQSDEYYFAKHAFLSSGLPSQFVSIPLVRSPAKLKWSISNIGLATFAKLGGKPWKVVTDEDDCLIVGVGQSHRWKDDDTIDRYYAYCVLSDSSGLYEDLRVLADTQEEASYLSALRSNLTSVFREHSDKYRRIAIHAPYRLRFSEVDAIDSSLREHSSGSQRQLKFAVLKFNDRSRFLGFSSTNSRVPFEGTVGDLARNEYLVWFEGLDVTRPTANARYGRPMHISFINPSPHLSDADMRGFIQDSLNLSGANWRGFNAKSLPVSVFYAQQIASYFKHFQRLGLKEPQLDRLTPWFL